MVEKLLEQYGMVVTVAGQRVRALFQPVTGKLERLAEARPGPLGRESRERYVYIGPVEPELREEMELSAGEKRCTVRSVHQIFGDNGPVYCWALCVEKGREDTWSMNS